MIIGVLKMIFGKLVGIDRIPKEKRAEFWRRLEAYSLKLAGELAEGATRGALEEGRRKPW